MRKEDKLQIREYRRPRRDMILTVTEPQRPAISINTPFKGVCYQVTRPYDWSVFGFEACEAEEIRRKKIALLLTPKEHDFFEKYCRVRDEEPEW